MAIPETARSVPVIGLPLAMPIITGIFLVLSLLGNGIRAYVNASRRSLGLDDGLVIFSQVAYVAVFGTTIRAVLAGIGTMNNGLNPFLLVESQKFYFAWIVTYLWCMVTLKTAVCVTLLRILPTTQQKMRLAVWLLMSLCWLAWAIDFLAVMFLCRPINASWDDSLVAQGKAECGSSEVLIVISHLLTAASVVTDIGCTVLPGIMLWQTQLHTTSKLEVFALLSIASIASIATFIRAPYFTHYSHPGDNLSYWCGYMVLYSNIETGIGLFASSLPAIRRFYRIFVPSQDSSRGSKPSNNSHPLATFGGTGGAPPGGGKGMPSSRRDRIGGGTADDSKKSSSYRHGDWERLTDEDSDKGILINAQGPPGGSRDSSNKRFGDRQIRVDHSFEVTTSSHDV